EVVGLVRPEKPPAGRPDPPGIVAIDVADLSPLHARYVADLGPLRAQHRADLSPLHARLHARVIRPGAKRGEPVCRIVDPHHGVSYWSALEGPRKKRPCPTNKHDAEILSGPRAKLQAQGRRYGCCKTLICN